MADLPRPMRMPIAALAALVAVSGGFGAVRAWAHEPRVFATTGFELVIALSAAAVALFALAGGRRGAALALGTTGGVWTASALLGQFSWHATLATTAQELLSPTEVLRRVASDPWFLGRFAAGATIAALGLVAAMDGQTRRWRRLALGAVMAGIPLSATVAAVLPVGRFLFAPAESAAGLARLAALVVLGITLAVLFSVGVQWVVRAFENEPQPAKPEA